MEGALPPVFDQPEAASWRAAASRVLKGADLIEALVSRSHDGIALGPLFAADLPSGPQPWRDASRPVAILQRMEHPVPAEAHRLAVIDLANGATGLTLVLAGASCGRGFGVPPTGIAMALDGLDLEGTPFRCECPTFLEARTVGTLLGALAVRGRDLTVLDIAIDPLGDMARTGMVPRIVRDLGVEDGMHAVMACIAAWLRDLRQYGLTTPALRADGRPHHDAGASEAQELAAVLATGVTYLRALEREGLDEARRALSFTLAADADQFLTLAKFRAFRRLWARVEEACGLRPAPIRLHAETSWRMLSRRDAWSNLLRNTIACGAALMGGADSITVLPFTSALGLPDEFARRLSRNTPLLLLQEAHIGRVADPGAGAGSVEFITGALCAEAWRLFQGLERAGGLATALQAGTWQASIGAVRAARRTDLASGRTALVGVTSFKGPAEREPSVVAPLPPASGPDVSNASAVFSALRPERDAEEFESEATP
ncbi:methylmalonyl-CoA mutase family protein [Lichenifustis flavocetrariae]|uniref:Methylmalonyl-CoA mutase family protein n=1 Tax=Lichenifustis flavocetrariae TaxID=2949735 RepID=A0AA42CMJ4_9HYPH|nr:methylmalonyl-CoA mutase family protein [Lichenifustis flavocetrariae]MCW6508447.1 methylmalonyl-CoA mutase family protein [Lichenifustis flavocetrariae]